MSKAHNEITEGLKDALAFVDGDTNGAIERKVEVDVVDIKELRKQLKMSQETFAKTYKIPLTTLRKWEQGVRRPDATARAYLQIISRAPEMTREILAA